MNMRPQVVIGSAVFALIASLSLEARSAVVGWYRMEGTPEAQIGTVVNSSGAADSAIASGQPFYYSANVVGKSIMDPLTETIHENNSSMAFYGGTATTYLQVADGNPFEAPDFTIEMFMKIDSVLNVYRHWVSHGSGGVTGGWLLRSLPIGTPATAYKPSSVIMNSSYGDTSDPDPIDDGIWHHFAFVVKTSDDGNNFGRIYLDYSLIAEYHNSNLDDYNSDVNAPFRIFAEEYLGNVDEVRFTSQILGPDQFLYNYVVPEPGSAGLLLIGTVLLASIRRSIRTTKSSVFQTTS